ncbi:hypothetical protein G6F55_006996 [Rhizopus delemar]|nr:hypothetical protein G6F55_006996 [Rhizopus delemar]
MKVDKAIWEVELKKLEDSTCAHWTNKGFKIKEIVSSNATESSSVGRNKTILWSKKYTCHRGPNVYVSKASGNHRPIQKESKKIGCPTCIMNTIVTSISSEDVPRKRVLCKCQPLAASINQQTHTEPTTTTISTSTSTSTPTELRSDGPTTTELVLAEDKSEAAWRTSLKRSIEALEVDLKQKEREAHAIKKKIKILKEQL